MLPVTCDLATCLLISINLNIFMTKPIAVHELISLSANTFPLNTALILKNRKINYLDLNNQLVQFSSGLLNFGAKRFDRIGVFLDKSFEAVISLFGSSLAACIFVPINPLLKPEQVAHILRDCNVSFLVTSADRLTLLRSVLVTCPDLRCVVNTDTASSMHLSGQFSVVYWAEFMATKFQAAFGVVDSDVASILYTSGSTGRPKGVVLSHRNMLVGAQSVASYLENTPNDVLLAILPLSFDAGLSQLTTAFHVGAAVVLFNYLLPRDVLSVINQEAVTGLTAVPPLFIQLAQLDWSGIACPSLRYFANTGGRMPLDVLTALRRRLPAAKPFLMYGLTESFRSTYLHPSEVDGRPDSIGKAIPNAEVFVLRDDGTPCGANEPGELVHRGPLVSLGYWNDPVKTAERFKLLPARLPNRPTGLQLPEYVVFSGDTVRQDEAGFLYFMGRRDEMIKVSGYRISPTEVEEILYAMQAVGECIAFAVDCARSGSAIQIIATQARPETPRSPLDIINMCRQKMPPYMVPSGVDFQRSPLPRNPNGKIDRVVLIAAWKAKSPAQSPAQSPTQSPMQSPALRTAHATTGASR